MDNNVIAEIVARDLCSSCGVCAGVCPADALTMTTLVNGDLSPQPGPGDCLPKCRLCLDVCPFLGGEHDPRPANEISYRELPSPTVFHEDIGWHLRSMVGHRRGDDLREMSSSGGLATWCLEQLLTSGAIDRAVVVRFAGSDRENPFEFIAAESVEELRSAAGSVYHPVSLDRMIKLILAGKERWAVVGVPCFCAALAKARRVRSRVPYLLGLACGGYQNRFYTDLLLARSGLPTGGIHKIDYRVDNPGTPAYNYCFQAETSAKRGRKIPYTGLPYFLGANGYFRLGACDFCRDVFAEQADACFTDAWLPEYYNDPAGTSLVVIRNEELNRMFQAGSESGELAIADIDPRQVAASQAGQVRRKRVLIDHRLGGTAADITRLERLHWRLQRATRLRSKSAWAGRRGTGLLDFWLAMADILAVQVTLFWLLPKLMSPPRKLLRKLKSLWGRGSN